MKPYSGTLAKPFDELKRGFGAIPSVAFERARKQDQLRTAEIRFKVFVLLNYFGIDYDDPRLWERLALALAKKHVRGFQEMRKPGAKSKWGIFERSNLRMAVDRMIDETGKSRSKGVTWACGVLAKREPWKTRLAHSTKPVEVLRRAYYDAPRS